MDDLERIINRVRKNGFAITKTRKEFKHLPRQEDVEVFGNHRLRKSIIVDKKRLRELFGNDFL